MGKLPTPKQLLVQMPCAFEWMRSTLPSTNYWLCPWASQVAQVELPSDVWMKPVVAVQLSGMYVCSSVKQGGAESEYLCSAETL